jgi:hypothetical protein
MVASVRCEKGKPVVRRGRKTSGLFLFRRQPSCRAEERGMIAPLPREGGSGCGFVPAPSTLVRRQTLILACSVASRVAQRTSRDERCSAHHHIRGRRWRYQQAVGRRKQANAQMDQELRLGGIPPRIVVADDHPPRSQRSQTDT